MIEINVFQRNVFEVGWQVPEYNLLVLITNYNWEITMSNISTADKQYLDNALRLGSEGRIIRFSEEEFVNFFQEQGVNINDEAYTEYGKTQNDRFRAWLDKADNKTVGSVILEIAALFRNKEQGQIISVKFSSGLEKIGEKLLSKPDRSQASVAGNCIHITIRPEIYNHIQRYLETEDYFHAVDEAYKIVREKLKSITGKERATEVFGEVGTKVEFLDGLYGNNTKKGTPQYDFYRGCGYIHLAIQFLRNEKAHSSAIDLDKNLAIHYLALASLAYDLISR